MDKITQNFMIIDRASFIFHNKLQPKEFKKFDHWIGNIQLQFCKEGYESVSGYLDMLAKGKIEEVK